jgi:hypothetical protein
MNESAIGGGSCSIFECRSRVAEQRIEMQELFV